MTQEALEPLGYILAFIAVVVNGMGKGGLGSNIGTLSVPLMALAMPPIQAAAILVPLLLLMDFISLWKFKGLVNWPIVKVCLPAGIVGIALGTAIFSQLSEDSIRLLIGFISLGFCGMQLVKKSSGRIQNPSTLKGSFWGCITGFTSFGIHAGGPPLNIYLLPLRLGSHMLMGTQAWLFGGINICKIAAYGWLGQLDWSNLHISFRLAPAAPVGVLLGFFLLNHLSQKTIYNFCYLSLALLGCVLLLQGSGFL